MKTYVLTIAKTFPAHHPKKGEPTHFSEKIASGMKPYDAAYDNIKLHTIRGNYPLWEKRFQEINAGRAILSVREWIGRPYHSEKNTLYNLDHTDGIGIEKLEFHEDQDDIPNIKYPIINNYSEPSINEIAHNDGLSIISFKDWFKNYDLSEPMAIIHFTWFRYLNIKGCQ